MSGTQFSLIRGRVMRLSKLDGCGNLVLGPRNSITSKGFISVALTANTDTGTAINVTNANGDSCIDDTPAPKFTGYGVVVSFCEVDPEIYSAMTGNDVVYAADGTTPVGFGVDTDVDVSNSGYALEVWSPTPAAACSGGSVKFGYQLLANLQPGVIGDYTIQNDAVNFQVTGSVTKDNAWGTGIYNVVENVSSVASPLNVAIPTTRHLHVELTDVAPPAAAGAGQLGVPATSAVAGIPGHYLPANSYGRANIAAMTGLTASPTSAWTTGQYVTMLDGNKAHWNSTTWIAGPA